MEHGWVVIKFGGTSVAAAEGWKTIAGRTKQLLPQQRVWTFSALAGVSDRLEAAIKEALAGRAGESLAWISAHRALADELKLSAKEYAPVEDVLADLDRRLQGVRLAEEAPPRLGRASWPPASWRRRGSAPRCWPRAACRRAGSTRASCWSPRRGRGISTRGAFSRRRSRRFTTRLGSSDGGGGRVLVTQGFIARTPDGETCLLGRGGSDTSGALLAALAGAELLEIWTDVPGLFTADPREVPEARLLRRVGYREARELATLGARVLHPPCLEPVARARIPVTIRCTPDPTLPSTVIESASEDHPAVTAVTGRRGTTLLTISTVAMWDTSGFLARLFAPFEELGFSVDLVGTSEAAVSVTLDRVPGGVDGAPFAALVDRLQDLGEVRVVHPCAVVSIVGRRIRAVLGELGGALGAFQDKPVHLVSNSSEDLNLSFVVDEDDGAVLVRRLHAALFADRAEDPRLGPAWVRLRGAPDERRRPPGGGASATRFWRSRPTASRATSTTCRRSASGRGNSPELSARSAASTTR